VIIEELLAIKLDFNFNDSSAKMVGLAPEAIFTKSLQICNPTNLLFGDLPSIFRLQANKRFAHLLNWEGFVNMGPGIHTNVRITLEKLWSPSRARRF
jgi:hypothetical protein